MKSLSQSTLRGCGLHSLRRQEFPDGTVVPWTVPELAELTSTTEGYALEMINRLIQDGSLNSGRVVFSPPRLQSQSTSPGVHCE